MFAAISWRRYLADRNMPASTPISTPSKVSIVITAYLYPEVSLIRRSH